MSFKTFGIEGVKIPAAHMVHCHGIGDLTELHIRIVPGSDPHSIGTCVGKNDVAAAADQFHQCLFGLVIADIGFGEYLDMIL